jgi:malate dehydrogenase (oxaloacetate-decarboxylating)(NADP+)
VSVKEFFTAAQDKFGRNVLIQFEDFGDLNPFRLLKEFQDAATTFNDFQRRHSGHGCWPVAMAGLIASNRLTGWTLGDHVFLFDGAGEAGTGIPDLIGHAILIECNMSLKEAHKHIYLVDSKGWVTSKRFEHGSTAVRHHTLPHSQ